MFSAPESYLPALVFRQVTGSIEILRGPQTPRWVYSKPAITRSLETGLGSY